MGGRDTDIGWMERALELAGEGRSKVQPNPMVGCVIVLDGKIIAEGYHKEYGGPHAEVLAMTAIAEMSKQDLSRATAYVTLEPCSHFGKTPPCSDMLITRGVGRVVYAMEDPNPEVSGQGHKKLIDKGVEVVTGVLNEEAAHLNRVFISNLKSSLPYITLKWAQSSDGFMDADVDAAKNRGSYPISSVNASKLVHGLRAMRGGILVGRKTVEVDNPRLSVRSTKGENPYRIILDPELKIDHSGLRMHNEEGLTYIVCNTTETIEEREGFVFIQGLENGLRSVLIKLRGDGVHSMLVEGGAYTLHSFIEEGLWDEAFVITAKSQLGEGLKAPERPMAGTLQDFDGDDTIDRYVRTIGA
jgi:diaminohydroxyphosphoribosylaminopyrimidine deaminase/5-amino-6-(5-phosphoribosylamino)uracil reductase